MTTTDSITDDLRSLLGKRVYLYSRQGEQLANGILTHWDRLYGGDTYVCAISTVSRIYFTPADVLSADDSVVTFR